MSEPDRIPIKVLYDGACPFCSNFVRMMRLRRNFVPELVDIRAGGPDVDAAVRAGLDLDEGMVLIHEGQMYHGHEAVQRLALMSTRSDLFNRVNAAVFRRPRLARFVYPLLAFGRRCVLAVLGRPRFADG